MLKKTNLIFALFSLIFFVGIAQNKQEKPKLVVGMVVDQMRWDYLYRYADRYGNDGFKRLLNEGFSSENNLINYIPTYTAIGHSSAYTGSVPSIHGIAGNDFIFQSTGEKMYCTEDQTVQGVGGGEGKTGSQSPKNLLTSTVTDQLKLATNFRSKVIGISLKDRGAILPAGHFADAAYWFDDATGNWITSTFYMEKLPQWVQGFNHQKLPEKYFKEGWNTLYPLDSYVLSTADDSPYEGPFKGEKKSTFPRNLKSIFKAQGDYELIKAIPAGNTFTLEFAKEAINNENLGKNPEGVTDFLAVSLSATDYIGHRFAINSIEVEDTYLRLDAELADFISFLDATVGKGNYIFFLTADHGASHNPKYFSDQGGPAGYFVTKEIQNKLNNKIKAKFGEDDVIYSLWNYQVHLDNQLIEEKSLDEAAIRKFIVTELRKEEGVAFVTDIEDAATAAIPQKIRERIINGYHPKRSGVIQFILEPQWYSGKQDGTGTTHGTWHSYDAHIPAIFMGWGVKPGKTSRETHITDIAPTISQLLNIEFPNGNIGEPIYEAFAE